MNYCRLKGYQCLNKNIQRNYIDGIYYVRLGYVMRMQIASYMHQERVTTGTVRPSC